MRKRKISFLACLALLILSSCSNIEKTKALKGVIDFSDWSFKDQGITNLNGEWEFYWNKLYTPKDFTENKKPLYVSLPGVWNDFKNGDIIHSGTGFATFRLVIKNSLKSGRLGLRVPYHFTNYKLWVNDSVVSENGKVSKTKEGVIPQTLPMYVYFDSVGDTTTLTLQVSNYHYATGGVPASYLIGNEKQIKRLRSKRVALDLFLVGILFIMTFHHLGLYYLMKKEYYTLFFSLVCFLVMLRTINLGETVFIELFPDFNFEIYSKLIFVGFFLGPPVFLLFTSKLFRKDSNKKLVKIFVLIGLLFSISLFFPAFYITKLIVPYFLVLVFEYSYLLFIVLKASIKKREGSAVALLGISVMMVTVVNDMLYDQQIIHTDYYSSYGLAFFIFSQSFLLSLKFSNAFKAIKKLSKKISKINVANSRFVPSEFLSFLGKKSIVDVKLGDYVTKKMTVFFADVRSFTTISESLTPKENFLFINSLLKRVGPIVRYNNGFIDKFIGDSIMALFPHNASEAILAAAEILKELEQYNIDNKDKNVMPIRLGIGINTGSLMLGTIGEKQRMDGTVISDTVNIASRLEGLSKRFDANVIISQDVLDEVEDTLSIDYRFLGNVPVKGKSETIAVYDVFSFDKDDIKFLKLKSKVIFEEAIEFYENNQYAESQVAFEKVLKILPNDKASKYYIDLMST